MASFAEYESDVRADYTRANFRFATQQGRPFGGRSLRLPIQRLSHGVVALLNHGQTHHGTASSSARLSTSDDAEAVHGRGIVGHRYRSQCRPEPEPGRRVGHRYRSQCGMEVPDFHRLASRPPRQTRAKNSAYKLLGKESMASELHF